MANDTEDYQGRVVIDREYAKLERSRAKAKALENNMKETISNYLKQDSVKKAIAKDAMGATRDPSRANTIFEKASGGTFSNDEDLVTGHEPRLWER